MSTSWKLSGELHPTDIAGASRSGTAFIVMNKAKGWWVVQKDPDGTGAVVPDSVKSGWVPAG